MHSKSIWRAMLLTALVALAWGAGAANAQPQQTGEDYAPADPVWPFPLYSTHPEEGGLYVAAEFVAYRQTNPLKAQNVGVRGFEVSAPTVVFQNAAGRTFSTQELGAPGTFIGSRTAALDVNMVSGPTDFQPGVTAEVGWKFADGSAFSIKYMIVTEVNLAHAATQSPSNNAVGNAFQDAFLFANVFNFPSDYGGPVNKITVPNPTFFQGSLTEQPVVPAPGAAYGIWNGASIMTEQFLQRMQQWSGTYRMPIFDSENYRINGTVGPRLTWIWEEYKWTTTDLDVNGISGPQFQSIYTNVVSNRLYGVFVGCQQEWYIGHGFAANLDVNGTLYADSVKTEVKYQLGTKFAGPQSKRSRHMWEISPAAQASLGLMWYPIEGVQIHAGYDLQAFFNTVSSPQPVDFNYGAVDPRFETSTVRILDGLDIGIAFIF